MQRSLHLYCIVDVLSFIYIDLYFRLFNPSSPIDGTAERQC